MTDCIFLPADCDIELADACPLNWQQGAAECLSLSLAECAERLDGQAVALVLPVEVVSSLLVSLPTRQARWVRKALPFAVEDMLAEDVELFHLALGEQVPDGRYRVLAVRRSLLADWLAQLQERGVQVAAIYVDADLLPRAGTQVLWLGQRGLLGGSGEARLAFNAAGWEQVQPLCEAPLLMQDGPAPYQLLAAGRATATDLAQGEFARRPQSQRWAIWWPVAYLAGLWLALHLGFNLVQAWQLERQADAYAASSLALYKKLFPEDLRIVNLKAQFAEHLSQEDQRHGGFINLLEQASVAIVKAQSALTVVQVDYSQSRGDLALQIQAKDFSELEHLRQRLTEAGVAVQLGSASRDEQGVTARVVLGGGV